MISTSREENTTCTSVRALVCSTSTSATAFRLLFPRPWASRLACSPTSSTPAINAYRCRVIVVSARGSRFCALRRSRPLLRCRAPARRTATRRRELGVDAGALQETLEARFVHGFRVRFLRRHDLLAHEAHERVIQRDHALRLANL